MLAGLRAPALQALTERVFRALVATPPGGRPVRRPTSLGLLCQVTGGTPADVERVVRQFGVAACAFLSYPDQAADRIPEDAIVDLTHEGLITGWDRLRMWVRQEVRDAELYRSLVRDAGLHRQGQRSLWRHPELAVAQRWLAEARPNLAWAARYAAGFADALDFLHLSEQAVRRKRLLQQGLALGVVLALLLGAGGFAWAQRARAEVQKARAEAAISEQQRLSRRVQELTVANPQLSEEATQLRTQNQELAWSILQLQADTARLDQEAGQLARGNERLQAQTKRVEEDRTVLVQRTAKTEAQIKETERQQEALAKQEPSLRATLGQLAAVNRQLREQALRAGLVPALLDGLIGSAGGEGPDRTYVQQLGSDLPTKMGLDGAKLDDRMQKLQFQLNVLERENLLLKRSLQELKQEKLRLVAQQASERDRNGRSRAERERLRTLDQQLASRLAQAEQALASARRILDQKEADLRQAALALERTRWRLEQLQAEIGRFTAENRLLESILASRSPKPPAVRPPR